MNTYGLSQEAILTETLSALPRPRPVPVFERPADIDPCSWEAMGIKEQGYVHFYDRCDLTGRERCRWAVRMRNEAMGLVQ